MFTKPAQTVKITLSGRVRTLIPLILLILLSAAGCDNNGTGPNQKDKGQYLLGAKYDSIRSYPEGGGIFIISLTPGMDFSGTVDLSLEADPALHAVLSNTVLDNSKQVAEILIRPESNVQLKKYSLLLTARHAGKVKTLALKVDMIQWENGSMETPILKRDEFKDWVIAQNPEYSSAFDPPDRFYHTYPEILIVEHYTCLTEKYELRFCYHVMIAPHDWSMILIRKRGSVNAGFAAKRETDGTIHSIAVSEYPTLLGY